MGDTFSHPLEFHQIPLGVGKEESKAEAEELRLGMSCVLNHGVRVEFKEFLFLNYGSPEILMSRADGMTLSDASLKRGTGYATPVRSIGFSW